jgi:hypothetical protein
MENLRFALCIQTMVTIHLRVAGTGRPPTTEYSRRAQYCSGAMAGTPPWLEAPASGMCQSRSARFDNCRRLRRQARCLTLCTLTVANGSRTSSEWRTRLSTVIKTQPFSCRLSRRIKSYSLRLHIQ